VRERYVSFTWNTRRGIRTWRYLRGVLFSADFSPCDCPCCPARRTRFSNSILLLIDIEKTSDSIRSRKSHRGWICATRVRRKIWGTERDGNYIRQRLRSTKSLRFSSFITCENSCKFFVANAWIFDQANRINFNGLNMSPKFCGTCIWKLNGRFFWKQDTSIIQRIKLMR